MLQASNLNIGYNQQVIYENINFSFSSSNLVGLIGKNGIGKSTLLQTICGNIKPIKGQVLINNQNLSLFSVKQKAQLISIVNTKPIFGFNLTAYDLVAAGRTPYLNTFAHLDANDKKIIQHSFESLQIDSIQNNYFNKLSDGQKQKVLIAKALAQNTPIILLDEPTAFLDYESKHLLFQLLQNIMSKQNKLILISSHDLDIMKRYVVDYIELK